MKAKDVKWCPQHGYPLPCDKCGMPLTQSQQKDIYKAGIREVVELLMTTADYECENEDGLPCISFWFLPEEWQAQKKKWGIE